MTLRAIDLTDEVWEAVQQLAVRQNTSVGGLISDVFSSARQRRPFGNVRKLPSGRWQTSYFHKAKRCTAPHTFATHAAALRYLTNIKRTLQREEINQVTGHPCTECAESTDLLVFEPDGWMCRPCVNELALKAMNA